MVIFKFKGKTYQITSNDNYRSNEDLLRDFEYCLEVRDYQTINNRITNGLKWGWMKELKNN
jgi:hypothetical protein